MSVESNCLESKSAIGVMMITAYIFEQMFFTFISVVVAGLAKVCVGLLRIFADVLGSVCRAEIIKNSFIACLEGGEKVGYAHAINEFWLLIVLDEE